MKTAQIKTIETKLEMYSALGPSGYFSDNAIKLRYELRKLQAAEFDKQLKQVLCREKI